MVQEVVLPCCFFPCLVTLSSLLQNWIFYMLFQGRSTVCVPSCLTLCDPMGSSVRGISQVLQPAQKVGMESGRRTVWEKETGDRMKVLKVGLGDSRPLGSRALFLGAASLLFSVLASRKYQPPVSPSVSRFTDYFKLSLLFSCTRATT